MKALGSFLALLFFASPALAITVPPLKTRITDQVGILKKSAPKLERLLEAHEKETGQQFAVLVIQSLENHALEDFSLEVVEKWKLGKAGKDNGLLMLIVVGDRKMRIEVGYGLEGDIPDALAGRILRDVLTPAFRKGHYDAGIKKALGLLVQAGGGHAIESAMPKPSRGTADTEAQDPLSIGAIFFWLFFLMMPMFFRGGRGVWVSSGGFSSGSSYSGGSSGFSGGGGSFGGGGASGGW